MSTNTSRETKQLLNILLAQALLAAETSARTAKISLAPVKESAQ